MKAWTAILSMGIGLALAGQPAIGTATASSDQGADGFIYGTVETRGGKVHTGVLRWDDEEIFWDDLFHSSKKVLPHMGYAEENVDGGDQTWWERVGRTIGREFGAGRQSRVLAVRFGDLASVRPSGADDAVLTLRDGTEVEVGGYANDVGTSVTVLDARPGRLEVRWKDIVEVRFGPTPSEIEPPARRLHGTVATTGAELVGFIQWDSQECLSSDRLDGDTGGERVSLEMGDIRSIHRRDRRSARVVLRDGQELVLSGTNDVDDDIRGIHVEDGRFGRVEVPWREFVSAVFDDPPDSGPGYDAFAPPRKLSGVVVLDGGSRLTGRLVFDLDEEWSWEMLDGSAGGLDYTIPFAMVVSIMPDERGGSLVALRTGETLELSGSHDMGKENDGLLVLPSGADEPTFVPWREIGRIDLH